MALGNAAKVAQKAQVTAATYCAYVGAATLLRVVVNVIMPHIFLLGPLLPIAVKN